MEKGGQGIIARPRTGKEKDTDLLHDHSISSLHGWIIVLPSLRTFSLLNVWIQVLTFSGNTPKGTGVTFYQLSGAFFIPVEMTHKINCYRGPSW